MNVQYDDIEWLGWAGIVMKEFETSYIVYIYILYLIVDLISLQNMIDW